MEMNIGQSLAEHIEEVWYILVVTIGALISLIWYGFRSAMKRLGRMEDTISGLTAIIDKEQLERIEEVIPVIPELLTKDLLLQHCKGMQLTCPQNTKIDQIAMDTKIIRSTIDKVSEKQDILRQVTLPKEYLTITTYEKAHLHLENAMDKNMKDIKDLIRELKSDFLLAIKERRV